MYLLPSWTVVLHWDAGVIVLWQACLLAMECCGLWKGSQHINKNKWISLACTASDWHSSMHTLFIGSIFWTSLHNACNSSNCLLGFNCFSSFLLIFLVCVPFLGMFYCFVDASIYLMSLVSGKFLKIFF